MIEQASRPSTGGIIGLWLSVFGVILGATSAFGQLQAALNRAWEVRAQSGVLGFVIKRLLSLGMVIGIAILVLASLVLNTWVSTAGSHFGVPSWAMTAASFLLAFAILYVLFGAIFKYLPDAEVDWDDVKVGAFITALLYVIGKIALGIYLGRAGAASPYGAAGALALILLFIYYSAMLLLLGAEFTQVWATHHGKEIRPSRGAGRLSEAA
jgi:membrane protein